MRVWFLIDELSFHSSQGFLLPRETKHGVRLLKADPFIGVMFVVQRDGGICGHCADEDGHQSDAFFVCLVEFLKDVGRPDFRQLDACFFANLAYRGLPSFFSGLNAARDLTPQTCQISCATEKQHLGVAVIGFENKN